MIGAYNMGGLLGAASTALFGSAPSAKNWGDVTDEKAYDSVSSANWDKERRRVEEASQDAQSAQALSSDAISILRDQATGKAASVAEAQAKAQQAQMQAAAASQASSARGAYDPARQRAAAYALQSGLGRLGGATAAAVAQERMDAQRALASAASQRYQQELAAEQARRAQSIGLLGMESAEDQANRAAQMQLQKDRQAYELGATASEQQAYGTQLGVMGSILGATAGAAFGGGK